jgi:hypothetical protein
LSATPAAGSFGVERSAEPIDDGAAPGLDLLLLADHPIDFPVESDEFAVDRLPGSGYGRRFTDLATPRRDQIEIRPTMFRGTSFSVRL